MAKERKKTKKERRENLEREVRDGLRRQNQLDRERTQGDGFREYGNEDQGDGQE